MQNGFSMNIHSPRKVDAGLVLSILLIIGALYAGFGKPARWDDATDRISKLEPRVDQDEKDIASLRAINSTQMSMIIRELDGIHRELKNK